MIKFEPLLGTILLFLNTKQKTNPQTGDVLQTLVNKQEKYQTRNRPFGIKPEASDEIWIQTTAIHLYTAEHSP